MKLETPINKNYAAVVVAIKTIVPLENCDNVVATPLFGFQAVIGKDVKVGDVGIMFPAETRLSENYCMENDLYRHAEMNGNPDKKGYIEDNRRVKAVKFRGNRSDCLFMPLASLEWTGAKIGELKEGDCFDKIGDHLICEKYERPVVMSRAQKAQKKAFKRVDEKFLPEHYDNENWFRNENVIPDETRIIVSQKIHGTSIRIGHTIVKRQLNLVERALKFMGVKIKETEFDYVYGSRKVIKDVNNPNQQHYYETDIWTTEGKKLVGMIPQNFIIYAELVGWTENGAPIQKDYTYRQPVGTCKMYVYRVAFVNAEGVITDLSWDQMRDFCKQRGLETVKELWRGKKGDFDAHYYLDVKFTDLQSGTGIMVNDLAIPLDDNGTVDEGVCIRIDGMVPVTYKAKSPIFLQHETKLIDQGVGDLEAEGSVKET